MHTKHLAAACYCFITTTFEVFLFPFFFCFSFLQEPWVGDKQTATLSKDVLPCKQLPLQDKLLLFPLQGVLIPVHPNQRGKRTLKTSVGIMRSESQLCVAKKVDECLFFFLIVSNHDGCFWQILVQIYEEMNNQCFSGNISKKH